MRVGDLIADGGLTSRIGGSRLSLCPSAYCNFLLEIAAPMLLSALAAFTSARAAAAGLSAPKTIILCILYVYYMRGLFQIDE